MKQTLATHASLRFPYDWALRWQFALALALVCAALLGRWLLDETAGDRAPFLLLFGVLLPLLQLVRPGPFLAAAGIGWLASVYLFVPGRLSLDIDTSLGVITSAVYGGVFLLAAVTSWLANRNRELRDQDQQALKESERRLRLLTDSVPVLISFIDTELRYQVSNKGYEAWFGRDREAMRGVPMREVLGDKAFEHVEPYAEAALSGKFTEFEAQLDYKDGGARFVHAQYIPDIRTDGTVAGFYAMVADVSNRKMVEESLRDADRRKDEFLATLAHELRNPLAAISLAMNVLQRVSNDPARVAEMTGLIQRQSLQLKRLIDDLLDMSRISRGAVKLEKKQTDLVSIVNEVLEDSRGVCEENGLTLLVDMPDRHIPVEVDAVRIAQVVNNLLHNACKFTDVGGEVRVSVEQEGEQVTVRVADTGVGIPPEQLQRIFEMFTQIEQNRGAVGLGIGLSLARSIMEQHGGTIEARSEGCGKGSEFLVRLDTCEAPARAAAEKDKEVLSAARSARKRIVAADDNTDALQGVKLMLQLKGHEVHTAADGIEALQQVKEQQPDVVLLDIGMPHMDGYEVARRIRQTQWGSDMLLVAMTGWGQDKDKQRALDAGFDTHLTKPVDLEDLEQLFAAQGADQQFLEETRRLNATG